MRPSSLTAYRRYMNNPCPLKSTRWIKGPDFLWHDEATWPQRPAVMNEDQGKDGDLDVNRTSFVSLTSATATPIDSMFERFANWHKLRKFVGWMLRFKNGLRNAIVRRKQGGHSPPQSEKKNRPLDVEGLMSAERAIIEVAQIGSFPDKWLSLKEKKKVKKSSHVIKLDSVLMEGILCVGGCLQNSPLQDETKHPAILPKDHHISTLIVRYYHSTSGHSGLKHTLSLIREKFWIVHARTLLRRILSSCVDRRKRQATVGQQNLASLPADRVILPNLRSVTWAWAVLGP